MGSTVKTTKDGFVTVRATGEPLGQVYPATGPATTDTTTVWKARTADGQWAPDLPPHFGSRAEAVTFLTTLAAS